MTARVTIAATASTWSSAILSREAVREFLAAKSKRIALLRNWHGTMSGYLQWLQHSDADSLESPLKSREEEGAIEK